MKKAFEALNISKNLNKVKGSVLELMAKKLSRTDIELLSKYNDFNSPIKSYADTLSNTTEINTVGLVVNNSNEVTKDISGSRTLLIKELSRINDSFDISKEFKELYHPQFGELLTDLKYKKVYLSNIRTLIRTPIWKKQRTLRPQRSSIIATDKIKNEIASSLCGVITLFHNTSTGEVGIIDGQHRVGALLLLAEKGYWNESETNILVEVFPTDSEESIAKLFKEINSAEPVRLVDLPAGRSMTDNGNGDDDVSEETQREVLELVASSLRDKYPEMFKASSRCRPPHVNLDVLRDDLWSSEVLRRHPKIDAMQLLQILEDANRQLAEKLRDKMSKETKASVLAAWEKATSNNFFLGMEKEWIEQLP